MKHYATKNISIYLKSIAVLLFVPVILMGLVSFKGKKESKQNVLLPFFAPSGVTKVNDIEYWGNYCYIATDKGLYRADKNASTRANTWVKMPANKSMNVTDLQMYREGSIEKEIIVLFSDATIGRIKKTAPTNIELTKCTNVSSTFRPSRVGKVPKSNIYFMINGTSDMKKVTFGSASCTAVPLKTINNKSLKAISFTYRKNNDFLFGSVGTGTSMSQPSWKYLAAFNKRGDDRWFLGGSSKGVTAYAGKIVHMIGNSTSNTVFMAGSKGYIYRSDDGGANWRYYAHGLKPSDNDITLYSMVKHGNYLYIATKYGVKYTSISGRQADWKTFAMLPGWRNKPTKIAKTGKDLIITVNWGRDGMMKKPLK